MSETKETIDVSEKGIAERKKLREGLKNEVLDQIAREPSPPVERHVNDKGEKVDLTGKVRRIPGSQ